MDKINFKDFQKLDIRIGTVTKAEVPEWSHWVMKLTVDLGEEIGERTIYAGIMKFYTHSEIEGKQFPFIVNLEPKKIGPEGDFSDGMMIMAVPSPEVSEGQNVSEDDEGIKPVLLTLSERVPNGTKVS